MAIERLLGSLQKVKSKGRNSWTACCPAHEDRSPSLAIRLVEDGRILLHCFGGCAVDDVVGAIGMDVGDLFPETEGRAQIKPAFYPSELLKIIYFETLVVNVAAEDLSQGKPLLQKDLDRLKLAAERISEASRYAGY
jgi:hypothetical protein